MESFINLYAVGSFGFLTLYFLSTITFTDLFTDGITLIALLGTLLVTIAYFFLAYNPKLLIIHIVKWSFAFPIVAYLIQSWMETKNGLNPAIFLPLLLVLVFAAAAPQALLWNQKWLFVIVLLTYLVFQYIQVGRLQTLTGSEKAFVLVILSLMLLYTLPFFIDRPNVEYLYVALDTLTIGTLTYYTIEDA